MISASGRAKQFSSRMANIWRVLSDVTYPLVAYTTVCTTFTLSSHTDVVDRVMSSTEPYIKPFTVFTSKICGFHTSVIRPTLYLLKWKSIKPVMLGDSSVSRCSFQYRHLLLWSLGASMTLVGLLPPLCDNGNLLVDGGYRRYHTFSMTLLLIMPQSTTFQSVQFFYAKTLLTTQTGVIDVLYGSQRRVRV